MKILMFGRGVIATQYAWALEKEGNQVEFYVRPGRAAQYGSTVNLEILDARVNKKGAKVKGKWDITMREELAPNHDFDLIIISVNHNQIAEAINWVTPRLGKATVLIFNNLWIKPIEAMGALPKDQIVWGFPGAGGAYVDKNTLHGGFLKSIFMGFIGEPSPQYKKVHDLFKKAGFSISEKKDMHSWLLIHFAMNVGLGAMALKKGSYNAVFDSAEDMKQVILLVREMIPLIRAKGGKIDKGTLLMMALPSGMIGSIMSKAMAEGKIFREIMKDAPAITSSNKENVSIFPRDAWNDAQKLGVKLPLLATYEHLFN